MNEGIKSLDEEREKLQKVSKHLMLLKKEQWGGDCDL